jgi:predicted DsbA family dithiol-disulfide isomerase
VGYAQRLARKYGSSLAHAEGMIRNMTATAADEGVTMRFDHIRSGNMFDGHRVLHLAAERGGPKVQNDLKERLLRAYLQDGEVISDPETLMRHATAAGLDPDEVRATLTSDRYAEDVRKDEAEASSLGISGVPFFVIGRYGVSGAQYAETLAKVIEKARSEQAPVMLESGAVCGPDGCA